ncbi:sce7725 family protein [Aliarcobacter lanthieri]|uniref:sce7725 family protein n=1 Tax=Aliarcobacter lanthieri TaxID=1355374 RepID=UPI00047C18E1|nr:sce7725 family protein [Aliarcobacter lanthieri]
MYFPYLYNKQAENLALRTLSTHSLLSKTIPIVETIFDDINIDWSDESAINNFIDKKFQALIKDFADNNNKLIIVINQSLISGGISFDKLYRKLSSYVGDNNIDDICYWGISNTDFENQKNNLIAKKCVIFYESSLNTITSNEVDIKYHILLDAEQSLSFINLGLENKVIISDAFKKQRTNRDYPSVSLFPNNIFIYNRMGLIGFGDYTILEKNPNQSDGGNMNTITVAAHMTLKEDGNICIKHYICTPEEVPDNSSRIANVINQVKEDASIFYQSNGLEKIINIATSTSLPKLKELTISHHIEKMNYLINQ